MGLSWQQGPLAPGAIGRFLVPGPLPDRLLFAEPGQTVIPHGIDRDLTTDGVHPGGQP
jgi:hypothetical protein